MDYEETIDFLAKFFVGQQVKIGNTVFDIIRVTENNEDLSTIFTVQLSNKQILEVHVEEERDLEIVGVFLDEKQIDAKDINFGTEKDK